MKAFASLFLAFGIAVAPMHAHAAAVRAPAAVPSILDAAEIAAASGAYRAQNTAGIATGRIREDDNKRSALAFALSGLLAFTGAALWRNLTCRDGGDARHFGEGLKTQTECYEEDGSRKGWSTPTKALVGAGVGLELVSLFYLVRHLREDRQQDAAQPATP
ncbi:MAG: hypothetical protein OXP70_08480 [Acidobacteriota bacterium]|nr:hypothetical protein [Acidobacteriota bacterium]